ncbi:hypothetical protein FDZ58_00705 [Ehrlichia ruminantium]|uniref:Uncharacterized protein n=1 Tax=Ehrlichia ruminantium (strain Welgevonden) TaxID=254945 RepID=A0A0H3LYM9_EHRRW|nr:hypothetical protein [Ehrlichia ruminantium]KYW98860.1 hypothetical protein AUR40_04990 [Ehrlichia ruminantium]QLK50201.1 hypothetical protein FDZ68_00705 [Ehrlichia ruminantium]QLK51126.1 hypothetical protein FDZ66_00710 [Ehrlichia ruminantium]QLK52960.1 hypothetical protein FDZ64_00705 [Ehrlichia ruminantium]QLK54797.1 hypothetical protein FDZ62_00720 [Ehrlichia ruminantium]
MLNDFYNLLLHIVSNPKSIALLILLLVIGSTYFFKYNKKLKKKLQPKDQSSVSTQENIGSMDKPFDKNYTPEHHVAHSTTFTIDSVSQVFESKEQSRSR